MDDTLRPSSAEQSEAAAASHSVLAKRILKVQMLKKEFNEFTYSIIFATCSNMGKHVPSNPDARPPPNHVTHHDSIDHGT